MKSSILVLLEPAMEKSSYESKYLPLMMKYLDSSLATIDVVGSNNAVSVIRREFKRVSSVPVSPKEYHGTGLFVGYLSYLLLSFFALTVIARRDKSLVLVSLGGHPYTGLVVSIVAKLSGKKSIVRISEPTRIVVRDRYAFGKVLSFFVRCAESLSLRFSDLIVTNRDMCWYNPLIRQKQVVLSQGVDTSRFFKKGGETVSARFPMLITVLGLINKKISAV